MTVDAYYGINNGYVNSSPFSVNLAGISGTPQYYASQYPFYKFTSNAQVC